MDSLITGIQDLISNPFGTPVGKLLEKATSEDEASEDWSTYMEICDVINESDEGPRDAIRAVKKLLINNVGRSNVVVLYTITVLETCVKNCGRRFHVLVAQRDFLNELVKIVTNKSNPTVIIDRILSALQTWADAFQGVNELGEVGRVVMELKNKGVEFPMTDLDHIAPIHTPARSCMPPVSPTRNKQKPRDSTSDDDLDDETLAQIEALQLEGRGEQFSEEAVTLNEEQKVKLRADLDVVGHNCKVLGEMLTELTPGQESSDDWLLLQELNRTCQRMQHRLVGLIEQVQNEEVTSELLRINDELNNVLLRYDRHERLRSGQVSSTQPSGADAGCVNLVNIDSTACSVGNTNSDKLANSGEFDMFAQSRESYEKSQQALKQQQHDNYTRNSADELSGLSAAVNLKSTSNPYELEEEERDLKEMAEWANATTSVASPDKTPQSATSSEFDKFLATRAGGDNDGESGQNGSQSNIASGNPANNEINGSVKTDGQKSTNRTINKGNAEDSMFSL